MNLKRTGYFGLVNLTTGYKNVTHSGHGYFSNIDPSFSQEFSVQPNFEQLEFLNNLFPEYMGIPIPVPIKITGNVPSKFFTTEIHGESHSHINVHTITISDNSVFFTQFFS